MAEDQVSFRPNSRCLVEPSSLRRRRDERNERRSKIVDQTPLAGQHDEVLCHEVWAELDRRTFHTERDIAVSVRGGRVTICGIVADRDTATAIRDAAGAVAGAGKVVDEMIVIDGVADSALLLG